MRNMFLTVALLAMPFGASAQDIVGQTIPAQEPVPVTSGAVGDALRVSSVEVFQDRSPTPTRGSVVIVRYFMDDVQSITANLNGATVPTLASPEGEVFEAVPRAENGPAAVVGETITAVFQIPLFATESSDEWKFQVGTFGTGVQVILQ